MTPDEIEKLARDKKPLPQYSTLPDACYYQAIRSLWDGVRSGRICKEEAHAEKKRMLRQYAEFRAAYERYCAAFREQQDNIRRIGTLRTDIAREPDERERLRLCIRAIGAMTGDRVFEKTEIGRLKIDAEE